MRTLLLTIDYPPNTGGVARYLSGYRKKHGADVLAPKFPETEEEGIIRRQLSWPLPPKWLPLLFWGLIYAKNYDEIVISHILPAGYLAILAKKPYTVILHGLDIVNAAKNKWKRRWAKRILDGAQKIVVNSRATGELLRKTLGDLYNYEIEYPAIMPPPPSEKDLRAEFPGKKIILSLGRLVARKGQEKVIRLLPKILREIPEAVFVIAGGGPERQNLELLAQSLNIEDKVVFLGKVKEHELPAVYAMCDVFIAPSLPSKDDWEGFGIVCLEAAYFGKPVVVTNAGGLPEAVEDNITGYVAGDDEELCRKITDLLKNDELARKMGEAGRERVAQKFLL